jgi:hypothetical protein
MQNGHVMLVLITLIAIISTPSTNGIQVLPHFNLVIEFFKELQTNYEGIMIQKIFIL